MEIKFRGKRVDNGKWVHGSLLLVNGEAYIYDSYFGDLEDTDFGYGFTRVLPKTVGQYTGMKDNEWVEIYEGDVIKCVGGEYYSGYYEINAIAKIEDVRDMAMYNFLNAEKIEIVGNVHDNPELLEV